MPVVLAAETLEVFSEPEQRNGGGAMTSDVLLIAWHEDRRWQRDQLPLVGEWTR